MYRRPPEDIGDCMRPPKQLRAPSQGPEGEQQQQQLLQQQKAEAALHAAPAAQAAPRGLPTGSRAAVEAGAVVIHQDHTPPQGGATQADSTAVLRPVLEGLPAAVPVRGGISSALRRFVGTRGADGRPGAGGLHARPLPLEALRQMPRRRRMYLPLRSHPPPRRSPSSPTAPEAEKAAPELPPYPSEKAAGTGELALLGKVPKERYASKWLPSQHSGNIPKSMQKIEKLPSFLATALEESSSLRTPKFKKDANNGAYDTTKYGSLMGKIAPVVQESMGWELGNLMHKPVVLMMYLNTVVGADGEACNATRDLLKTKRKDKRVVATNNFIESELYSNGVLRPQETDLLFLAVAARLGEGSYESVVELLRTLPSGQPRPHLEALGALRMQSPDALRGLKGHVADMWWAGWAEKTAADGITPDMEMRMEAVTLRDNKDANVRDRVAYDILVFIGMVEPPTMAQVPNMTRYLEEIRGLPRRQYIDTLRLAGYFVGENPLSRALKMESSLLRRVAAVSPLQKVLEALDCLDHEQAEETVADETRVRARGLLEDLGALIADGKAIATLLTRRSFRRVDGETGEFIGPDEFLCQIADLVGLVKQLLKDLAALAGDLQTLTPEAQRLAQGGWEPKASDFIVFYSISPYNTPVSERVLATWPVAGRPLASATLVEAYGRRAPLGAAPISAVRDATRAAVVSVPEAEVLLDALSGGEENRTVICSEIATLGEHLCKPGLKIKQGGGLGPVGRLAFQMLMVNAAAGRNAAANFRRRKVSDGDHLVGELADCATQVWNASGKPLSLPSGGPKPAVVRATPTSNAGVVGRLHRKSIGPAIDRQRRDGARDLPDDDRIPVIFLEQLDTPVTTHDDWNERPTTVVATGDCKPDGEWPGGAAPARFDAAPDDGAVVEKISDIISLFPAGSVLATSDHSRLATTSADSLFTFLEGKEVALFLPDVARAERGLTDDNGSVKLSHPGVRRFMAALFTLSVVDRLMQGAIRHWFRPGG